MDNAQNLVDLLKVIFSATELRKFEHENGTIAPIELKLDDSIIMISNSTGNTAISTMLHIHVPDVFKTFNLVMDNGCEIIEQLVNKPGDPDIRGAFMDFAGNYWAVSTQTNQ